VYECPKTIRPDLIGKTIVDILDPRPHGDGRIPPLIDFGEFVVAEEGDARIRSIPIMNGKPNPYGLRIIRSIDPCYDQYEPGKKLDEYLPGYSAILGKPDYVLNSYERQLAVLRSIDEESASRRTRIG
jgi:hypothetical protein